MTVEPAFNNVVEAEAVRHSKSLLSIQRTIYYLVKKDLNRVLTDTILISLRLVVRNIE